MPKTELLISRMMSLLDRLEPLLPAHDAPPDWLAHAFRWCRQAGHGWLHPIHAPHQIALDALLGLDHQKDAIQRNTRQFLAGKQANNILLWGSRGTGKSSLVKAVFNAYRDAGLRLIEIDKDDLIQLPDIFERVGNRPEPFILFCDDLSFDASESSYKALKAALEGSLTVTPDNVLIYATSNRRHLLPEFQSENREAQNVDGELHHGESVEEKMSLSDRFGLWIAFHPFSQAQYLAIVQHWLDRFSPGFYLHADREQIERAALQWALQRGSRSGRTAWQFARDWSGRDLFQAD